MNTKTILTLGALGAGVSPSIASASEAVAQILEQKSVHPKTVQVLEELTSISAIYFDDASRKVMIDASVLPQDLLESLEGSSEVTVDKVSGDFFFDEGFANLLAEENVFSKLGSLEAIRANIALLDSLSEKSSPVIAASLENHTEIPFF